MLGKVKHYQASIRSSQGDERRQDRAGERSTPPPQNNLRNSRLVGSVRVRVSHQNAAFSPRHHRALLAGRSHTRAACTRLSRGS